MVGTHAGSCHCGAIRFTVTHDPVELTTCDCSLCTKRNALMAKVPEAALRIDAGEELLATYEWNSGVAKHHFCRRCGIYVFHRKRAAPDHFGVNVFCLDGFDAASLPVRATEGIGMSVVCDSPRDEWRGPRVPDPVERYGEDRSRLPAALRHGEVSAMTIKAIMVDVDGVLVVHPDARGWSIDLERDLGIPPALLQSAFFQPHWDDILHGRASLRDRLGPVLRDIAPHVPYETLVDYWFRHDAHLDAALLAELASIRAGGTQVHLATVQEHERARHLWNDLDFRSRFDGLHYAADLGYAKPDAGFYTSIERRTGFAPRDLFFIDDKIANVEAARICGWNAALWTGEVSLRSLLPYEL